MIATKNIEEEIQAQKKIISRLKREIFGIDKTSKSSYIRDFYLEFGSYEGICSIESVIRKATSSDIVYFGDYHPLRASQQWVCRLMKELTGRGRRIILAIEMLYEHQQEILDRWMKGMISEEEFLESIDYDSEWGFNWESYRTIFTLAKDPFIPIFGIDSEPRDHLRYIRMRDRMIARRLKNIRSFFPEHLILVFVGESHLASNHLPSEVRKVCSDEFRETVIVQNIDEIYWSLLRKGKSDAEAVRVRDNRFCIFTASPIIKYQSYREIIDIWIEGEAGDPWTPVLQEMVDNILIFLLGDAGKLRVTIKGHLRESIDAVFPEVQFRRTYHSFSLYLRSRRTSHLGLMVGRENLKKFGASYLPVENAFLLVKFDPVHTAREAARFVVYAMRDEIGPENRIRRGTEDRFYAFVFEEALAYFGSKIINPTQDYKDTDELISAIDSRGVVRKPAPRLSLSETARIVRILKYHFKREKKGAGTLRTTRKLRAVYGLDIKKRLLIIRALGHALGEALYRSYHDGGTSRRDILGLYRETFERAGKAKALYMKWVKKTAPYRGVWGIGG